MLITFDCPHCRSSLEINAVAVGATVTCPHCREYVKVPSEGLGPGTTIGGFRIESKLGAGGMGEVYLARQLSMDRDVALKILPTQLGLRKELADRFLNELKVLAKLDHPNIVPAYEAGTDSGIHFFAMMYLRGESLEERIRREQALAEKEALQIVRKLAGALAYAWNRHRLLHRDLKPSNVIADESGEPRLVDFGLAKSLQAKSGLTLASVMVGTPNYMSPEQVDGSAELDAGADMYSLGATLYNMLTGQVPFHSTSVMEVLKKQMTESLPDPREYNPEISEGCIALLEILLSKERGQRHETWEAVLADIERVLAGQLPTRAAPGQSTLIRIRDHAALAELRKKMPRVKRVVAPKLAAPAAVHIPAPVLKKKAPVVGVAVGIAAALVIIGLVITVLRKPAAAASSAAVPERGPAAGGLPEGTKAQAAYLAAMEYAAARAEDFDGALKRFEAARSAGNGTDIEVKAAEQILRLKERKQKAAEAAWQSLKGQAQAKAAQGQYAAALELLEKYAGVGAKDTEPQRAKLADEMRAKLDAQSAAKEAERATAAEAAAKKAAETAEAEAKAAAAKQAEEAKAALAADYGSAAERLLKGEAEAAARGLAEAAKQAEGPAAAALQAASELAQGAADIPGAILAGFEREKGKETQVELRDGRRERLVVAGVSGDRVSVRRQMAAGYAELTIGLGDLSTEEKMRRAGGVGAGKTQASLLQGLILWEAGSPKASESFAAVKGGLGEALANAAEAAQAEAQDKAARQGLLNLLATLGVKADLLDQEKTAEAIGKKGWTKQQAEQAAQWVESFRAKYGGTKTAESCRSVLDALAGASAAGDAGKPAPRPAPATPQQVAVKVASAPAAAAAAQSAAKEEKRESEARQALLGLLNLAGVGTDLGRTPELMAQVASNAYPETGAKIREMAEAFEKTYGQTQLAKTKWRLVDILKQAGPKPLGYPLLQATEENVRRAVDEFMADNKAKWTVTHQIKDGGISLNSWNGGPENDIRALAGLPLVSFTICGAKSIEPLRGMPLKLLNLGGCWSKLLRDLSPVEGMPLKSINFDCTSVDTLKPLHKLPDLTVLAISGARPKQLEELAGLKLESFSLSFSPDVKDLSCLKGMPLKSLSLERCPAIKDISALKGMPVTTLSVRNGPAIKDISVLKDMPLTSLNLFDTAVADLEPLCGMPLKQVWIENSRVSDLGPLKGMPLNILGVSGMEVADLSSLRGMPLTELNIQNTLVTDFSPLADMHFVILRISHSSKAIDLASLAGVRCSKHLTIMGKVKSWAPLKDLGRPGPETLHLPAGWETMEDADKLPDCFPDLPRLLLSGVNRKVAEIVVRFPALKLINPDGGNSKGITMDEFKNTYGPKEKSEKAKGK